MNKQGFPLDLLDKLMVCEVNEPSGGFFSLEDPMLVQKFTEQIHRNALANLSQHPSYGFVHQVVRMPEVHFCIAQTP